MRFARPEFLYALLTVPVMLIYLLYFRAQDIPGFRFSSNFWLSKEGIRKSLTLQSFILGCFRVIAMISLIIAMARPQRGLRSEETTTKATDIMICLDASRSMLSIDFKPHNRFEVAKAITKEFIEGRQYDRLGLAIFAEHAVTQCPLTTDRSAILTIIDQVKVGIIPPDQTAIGLGLATSVNRLKNSQAKSKVIILLTDGANNAGTIDPLTAAKTAAAYGIKIYSIGAGSAEGGLVPVPDPFLGERLVRIKDDIDEDLMLKISEETKGKYFRAKTPESLKTIFKEIDALEKTDIKTQEYVDYEELYLGFLLLSIGFVFVEILLNKTLFRTNP